MLIDSHCHLNHEKFGERPAADIIKRAQEAGVDGMLTINVKVATEFEEILDIAQAHQNIWCTVGTHPHHASVAEEKAITQDNLVKLAQSDANVIGIGESGLDYYYDFSTKEDQQESFRKHIRACIETDLPLIVHARDADIDIMDIIKEEGSGSKLKGVMHCFSSGAAMADEALDFGFYISFSGIVTFKNATELQDIAKTVPLDRILVETDAPYLAPQPYRGHTNEPAYVVHTAKKLAELHDVTAEAIAEYSTENFFELFDKARIT